MGGKKSGCLVEKGLARLIVEPGRDAPFELFEEVRNAVGQLMALLPKLLEASVTQVFEHRQQPPKELVEVCSLIVNRSHDREFDIRLSESARGRGALASEIPITL